jgi:uncharacterized membrane protein YbhN (UPF0104 family)
LERLVDVVALVIIGVLALLVLGTVPDWLLTAAVVAGVVGLVGLTGARFVPRVDQWLIASITRLPIPTQFGTRLTTLSSQFLLGMGALQNRKQRMNVVALTAIIWILDVMFALVIGHAFDLPLSVPQSMVLLAALGLASAVPSTPGYVGVYQFVAVTVLVPFGFSRDQALVQVIGLQGIAYVVEIIWGTLGLWYLTRPHGELPWRPLAASATQAVE